MIVKKRKSIKAMTDSEFYTRDVPSVPEGKVVVKPHRGDWTVFIGLPDGTVAYQWCESKAAAQREADYARNHIKKNGSQDDFWIGQGYKIWNPNVESKRSVKCSRPAKRRFTITAASKTDLTRKLSKLYNDYMAIDDDRALKKTGMTLAEYNALPDVFERLQKNGHVNTFMTGLANYFKKFGFSVSLDGTDYEITASTSTKRKRIIKEAASSGVLLKTECKEGTYYLTKSSTKQKTFWSADVSNANVFAKKESALNKLYAVLRKLPENAFYDEDAIFDFEDISDMKSAEFAEFFITDTSGNDIEDISEEVKKSLLSDEQFIASVFDDDFDDDDIEESTSIKCKRTIKADALAEFRKDWTERIFDKNYPSERITVYFKDGRNSAQYPATALDSMMKESIVDYIIDSNTGELLYESEHGDVRASKSVECSALDDARDNREELSGTYYIVYNGDIIVETDGTGDAGEDALAEVFMMDADALSAAVEYLNSFGDDLIEEDEVSDAGEVARVLSQFIQMEYDEGQMDPTYFGSEIYWVGGRIEWFDAADLAESNNVDEWIENTDLSAEDLGIDLDIDSAQSVECGDAIADRFMVDLMYQKNGGYAEDRYFDDWSEVEAYAHDGLMRGFYARIWDKQTGETITISPDEYNEAWENGAADFDINEDIVKFKEKIVKGSQSVKCSESIMAFQDSLTDELYRVADQEILSVSDLATYDPYVTIDEDSFECTFTRTAWGAYLQYGIRFDAHSDKFDFKSYFDWDKIEREQLSWLDPDSDTCFATVRFFIAVDGSKTHADVEDVIVTRDGHYSEWDTEQYKNIIDFDKFGEAIVQLAEPTVQEIHSTLSQFEPDLYEDDIESSTSIQAEHTTLRDRDITSVDDVRELVLYITNDGDLYRQRTIPIIENLKRKVKKGNYDRELAVKAWQYLADDGVRKYDKEFGSGRGSLTLLDKATREEIARELRDYYEEQVMWDANHPDELTTM